MDVEMFRDYCLAKIATTEELPFGPDVLVFKVMGKMYATVSLEAEEPRANLKCDPERSLLLRDEYDCIIPGYHMNKKHWNTLYIEEVPTRLLKELVDHSYDLVVSKLPKSIREELSS